MTEPTEHPDIVERDTLLLTTILAQDIGTIANIIQVTSEYDDGDLYDRLSQAYYELTNNDSDPDTMIRLREDDDQ